MRGTSERAVESSRRSGRSWHPGAAVALACAASLVWVGGCSDCGGQLATGRDSGGLADASSGTDAGSDERSVAACSDGVDNDGDGAADCEDPSCGGVSACMVRRDAGPPPDECHVVDGMDAVVACEEEAPPESFEPDVQWVWAGEGEEVYSIVTPLVANLTDDDGNGEVDLCDIPDVVVVASSSQGSPGQTGHIYVLDGETGAVHFRVERAVDHSVTPALGDIDGDGLVEIVTVLVGGHLVAFEHDGTFKWEGGGPWVAARGGAPYSGAVALADFDTDGDVEILAGNLLADHEGTVLWIAPQPASAWSATTAADLDGDGDLEMVLGHAAYHHDGTPLFVASGVLPGYPQIADLDGDSLPEVLVTNQYGLTVLEHDGTVKYGPLRPTGSPTGPTTWLRPATIHDFDGDGAPEYASSSASFYTVYDPDGSIVWSAPVSDQSGIAAGTAFDFLGDGIAEAMYADEQHLFIFDGAGTPILTTDRTSGTLTEYPVVADIDNDGSAEIVVVSNAVGLNASSPTVQVIRDVSDRWIQARRIWNQHTYHVTNVREDGTIPQHEPPSWRDLNTFRTNAQIEGGALCVPLI